jgi:hypothetical protein
MRLLVLLFICASCAGYSFKEKNNPFSQYGIKTLSVPMFYNHSNFSNLSGVFTQKIFHTLTDFKELKLYSGAQATDAILIGIIESPEKMKDAVVTESRTNSSNIYEEDVLGTNREEFLIPNVNSLRLKLRIIVVKHPTLEEIKFLQSKLGEKALSSKIIFNEVIDLKTNYTFTELESGGVEVLGSQNRGVKKDSLRKLATSAANSFKDMMLYAF